MARARLVQEAVWRPPGDAVQHLRFLQIRRGSAKAPFDLTHELLAHELLGNAQVGIVPGEREVVAVHDAPRVELGI
eukprot:13362439-Alexandrium_andersonii.AAC.1